MENSNRFEEEEAALQVPEMDMDDMAEAVEESLQTAADLTKRLAELNKEMEKAFKAVEMFCHGDQKESFKVVYDNTHRNTLRHLDECMEDYKKHLVENVL